jgi:hypothetical protein
MPWFAGLTVLAILLAAQCVYATTLITFDERAHSTPLSTEYSGLGVVLSSTAPIGPGVSPDPADWLHPGEAVAPFVFAIVGVPSTSTPSLPNKIIGAKFDSGGSLIGCERCGIRISFLDPIPTEVSLFITDPDSGQSARFLGPGGLLGAIAIAPASSSFPELVSFSHLGGITEVELVSAPGVGIGFDSLQISAPVPEPAAGSLLAAFALSTAIAKRRRRGPG